MLNVTIVSPSFNQCQFVERTLESVARQKYSNIEHIIQDGGSTDGTLDLLKRYVEQEQRADLYVERDEGQADAINRGFARASGDVLTWLNTDDFYLDSSVIQDVVGIFENNPEIDVVYGRGVFVNEEQEQLRSAFIHDNAELLQHKFVWSVGILQPALFFRKRLIEDLGALDLSLSCAFDYELWVRFLMNGAKFHFYDRDMVAATFHQNAKSSSLRLAQLQESAEVTKWYYGFCSAEWIERIAECEVAKRNGIVDAVNSEISPRQAKAVAAIATGLFLNQNSNNASRLALLKAPEARDFQKSRSMAERLGLLDFDRVIVTTFDDAYLAQGLTLIASIRRHEARAVPILIYDLNLSNSSRIILNELENVHLIDYPVGAVHAYPEFLSPKSYGYKCVAIHDARNYVEDGGSVLWIDAGVALLRPLDEIYKRIAKDDVFFVDHDDKPNWPFYNATFCHPVAAERMNATAAELTAKHLCSCLVGYKKGGCMAALFADADLYARDRDIVTWRKHSLFTGEVSAEFPFAEPDPSRAVQWKTIQDAANGGSVAKVRKTFGYLGHRQDQSIFSILAARYNAPIQSAHAFCRSDENSSRASYLNWVSGSVSQNVRGVSNAPDHIVGAVTYHHRGTFVDDTPISKAKGNSISLVILGNGPSLKGFDFSQFAEFDTIGMNAAYRYWDQIGWYPSYYICLDKVVGLSHEQHIARLIRERAENGIRVFILRKNLIGRLPSDLASLSQVWDFDDMKAEVDLLSPMPITTGSHAALIGALLGYQKITLMGIDCNYVEELPEARKTQGTALELVATPKRNPNYFFDDYQQAGDQYNIPNPEPDLHLDSWRAAAPVLSANGIEVWNGSEISKVDAFPKRDFDEIREELRQDLKLQHAIIVGPYPRFMRASIDETGIVAGLSLQKRGDSFVMVDVGAHFGTSASPFNDLEWTIYCFEPDSANREKLKRRFQNARNITIDSRAVSDHQASNVSFFRSDESTGISGLHAFHESHEQLGTVDVTTISEVVDEHNLKHVDFLKIDVEGFDLSVLKGVPWDKIRPDVIECEFEDGKTKSLGHTWNDIADYLLEKGYVVYISEWHPIIKYGKPHDWLGLKRYPCELNSEAAWGNILAFEEDPGSVLLRKEADKHVHCMANAREGALSGTFDGASRGSGKMLGLKHMATNPKQKVRARLLRYAGALKARSPWLYQAGRVAWWGGRVVRRHFLKVLLGAIAMLALLILPSYLPVSSFRGLFWGLAVLVGLAGIGLVLTPVMKEVFGKIRLKAFIAVSRVVDNRVGQYRYELIRIIEKLSILESDAARAMVTEGKASNDETWMKAVDELRQDALFQRFPRALSPEQLDALQNDWAKRLGIQVTKPLLAYMSGRLKVIEQNLAGRLAASSEDAILRTLVASAVKKKNLEVLEIGTLFGMDLAIIYDHNIPHFDNVHLTAIDPLDGYYGSGILDTVLNIPVTRRTFWRNMDIAGVPRRDVTLIECLSTEEKAKSAATVKKYDLLIIDGDHSYEGVKADFENYAGMVAPGGFILFDDYGADVWPGVQKCVDEEVMGKTDLEFIGTQGNTAVFRVRSEHIT